jgi:hypothetical protein
MEGVKDNIVTEIDNYIDSVAPESCLNGIKLFELCEQYEVDVRFAMAQAEIESHYGTKGIAAKTNIVWNVKTYCHEEPLSMFSVVDIDGEKCTLTAYVEDGRIIDNCVIDKANDTISPIDVAPVYNRPRIKFKGYDLGLCAEETLPEKVDGVWYIPIGQIISFIGGDVERTKGKIKVGVYGRTAEYTENSATVMTNNGEYTMNAPCLRLKQGQLYVPMDTFGKPIRMHAFLYEHNNFISVESEVEHVPIPEQP